MCQLPSHPNEFACGIGITKTDASEIASHIKNRIFQDGRQTYFLFVSDRWNLNVDKYQRSILFLLVYSSILLPLAVCTIAAIGRSGFPLTPNLQFWYL